MMRINLLPVARKKKPKALPAVITSTTLVAVFTTAVLVFLFFYINSRLQETTARFNANEQKKTELKKTIKEVENLEKLNKTFEERNKLIEQLRKNQNIPVMVLDEISRNLPNGVWLQAMTVSGGSVNLDGYAFTNSDVVAYVNNMKNSKVFSDIFLQESKQTEIEKISMYQFKLTFRVVA